MCIKVKVSIFKVIQQVVIEADRFSREQFVPSDPDWGCFAVATSCLNLKCPKTSSACQRWERYIQSRCPCRWSGAWRQRFHRRTDYAPVKLCLSWMPLRQTALCCNCIAACYIVGCYIVNCYIVGALHIKWEEQFHRTHSQFLCCEASDQWDFLTMFFAEHS